MRWQEMYSKEIIMIKLKELINEQVKPGDAFKAAGGDVDVIIDKFMGGKWKFVTFNMNRGYVSGIGVMSKPHLRQDLKIKLSSSHKSKIKKMLKNPEDIHYVENDDLGIKVKDILRVI